ncbi:MAG TPA: hypothetical protein VK204_19215 [Nocardioidaceae bacterium]|nr:hypothetical protein [Nocardioidaceae bacterium]
MATALTRRSSASISVGTVILVLWLVIGAIAAAQRGYLSQNQVNCTEASTVVVTILAGPLNYVGANPRIACRAPQPSK